MAVKVISHFCCRSLYVWSLKDPIEEHKETMSLDLDFEHLQRVCLGKSYFYYKLMSKPLRMAVKTQPFDNEIFETSFIVKQHLVYRLVSSLTCSSGN